MRKSEKPQVILFYPRTGYDFGSTVAPPHSILTVAAPMLEKGYTVAAIDERVERVNEGTLKSLVSSDLLYVGISSMTGTQIKHALRLARMVRKVTDGRIPLVWGGPHPTIMPEQTLEDENVDIVVIGEGDRTGLELVEAIESKADLQTVKGIVYTDGGSVVRTEERPLLDVEELLPVPWELIDVEKYVHTDMYVKHRSRILDIGQTSRGCPNQCGFCCSATIRKRKWRPMSVEKSLDWIVECARKFKLDGFWLRDDEFYIDRKRAHRICEGIISEGLDVKFYTAGTRVDVFGRATEEEIKTLKKAGADTLKFGAESGSQRILDLMKKGITVEQTLAANQRCKKHNIIPAFTFFVGYPTETFEDIDKTIDLYVRLKTENRRAQFESIATYTAFPGTPDFSLALEHGLKPPQTLEQWQDWVYDEYDVSGKQIPWFDRTERISIGNIAYMAVLANVLENLMGSAKNRFLRSLCKGASKPIGLYYWLKLKNKMYENAPELPLIRHLRKELFYA